MIPKPDENDLVFRFSDPRQKKIYEELSDLIGKGPASFFRDACWLVANPIVLESSAHLVAHLLRETESALRAVFRPLVNESVSQKDENSEKARSEIRSILKELGMEETSSEAQAWFDLSKKIHGLAHRYSLEGPRQIGEISEVWSNALTFLPVILSEIREHFLKWFPILDNLLSHKQPTADDLKKLHNEVPNNIKMRGYFFGRLKNPEWLEPLWDTGFFSHPPKPAQDKEEGTISFPPWPEAKYLARMADYEPELIAQIIEEMHQTDNVVVEADLVDAMLLMPAEIAARLIDKAKSWASSPFIYRTLSESLGELIAHLAKGGKAKEALELAQILFEVLPDSNQRQEDQKDNKYQFPPVPHARFDLWDYKKILDKNFPELVQAAGLPALEMLCDLLEKAIRFSNREQSYDNREDYSHIWRQSIEGHDAYPGHNLRYILVDGIRDSAELIVRCGKAKVEQVVDTLEKRSWSVFHRIALHVISVFPDQAMLLVKERLTDRNLFDDVNCSHEYVHLIRQCFNKLNKIDQNKILDWIEAGPDMEKFIEERQSETGSYPKEEDIIRIKEVWQRDRLAWICAENLPDSWKAKYQDLTKRLGEPMRPEFPPYQEGPKAKEELKSMSVKEIVDFLIKWRPPETPLDEPSPRSLGQTLTDVIAEDPVRFASEAGQFWGLDPTYVRSLLEGLGDGLKGGKAFEWEPVFELAKWVISEPPEIPGRRPRYIVADPDWGWTRQAIAKLLEAGFEEGPGTISIKLREKAWEILEDLVQDPDPSPEDEKQSGGSNMDPATLSINTTRGQALHAIIRYALWVRRYLEKQSDAEARIKKGFEEMPEVLEVLDSHLNTNQDPSLAIRAVYGQWFPWLTLLDSNWAKNKAALIFPLDNEKKAYFQAAWNVYINFCPPFNDVLELLREQYHHAVKMIDENESGDGFEVRVGYKLAEHLMIYYWRGKLEHNDPLLMEFWAKAPDKIRGHAIEFVGRALMQTKNEIDCDILKRLQNLWEDRISKTKSNPDKNQKEISSFGWWFISEKFDLEWSLTKLAEALRCFPKSESDHMVIEQLSKNVEAYPDKVLECLDLLVRGHKEPWVIELNKQHIRKILQVALGRDDLRDQARRIINYLGSRGFIDFRDLLP